AIAAWLLAELGFDDLTLTSEEVGVIVSLARNAKHTLTHEDKAVITYRGKSLTLTREEFDNLAMPFVQKSLDICEQALQDANLSITDIKGVVMVGGSTRVPLVV